MRPRRLWPVPAALALAACGTREKQASPAWPERGVESPAWLAHSIDVREQGPAGHMEQAEKAARDCGVTGIWVDGDIIGLVMSIRSVADGERAEALACLRNWMKAHPELEFYIGGSEEDWGGGAEPHRR